MANHMSAGSPDQSAPGVAEVARASGGAARTDGLRVGVLGAPGVSTSTASRQVGQNEQ